MSDTPTNGFVRATEREVNDFAARMRQLPDCRDKVIALGLLEQARAHLLVAAARRLTEHEVRASQDEAVAAALADDPSGRHPRWYRVYADPNLGKAETSEASVANRDEIEAAFLAAERKARGDALAELAAKMQSESAARDAHVMNIMRAAEREYGLGQDEFLRTGNRRAIFDGLHRLFAAMRGFFFKDGGYARVR